MPTKRSGKNANNTSAGPENASLTDIFAGEQFGEFGELPDSLEAAIGALVRLALKSGGYIGLSVTDDGGSCRLAIRTGTLSADRRFYNRASFEAAIARSYASIRSAKGV